MQQEIINTAVYFYIFVCISLLLFNIGYIFSRRKKDVRERKKIEKMMKLQKILINSNEWTLSDKQADFLKKIQNTPQLLIFHKALNENKNVFSESEMNSFLCKCSPIFFELAVKYIRKSSIDRAFFAYFAAENFRTVSEYYRNLSSVLLLFTEDSTVYCRENLLKAMCALGNVDAFEQMLRLMKIYNWYHNPKLISDGMQIFNGDKEKLARRLWKHRNEWDMQVRVALVQFMTNRQEDYSDLMIKAFDEEEMDVRFAIVRYFNKHPCTVMKEKLIRIVEEENELAISAVLALTAFEGKEIKTVLRKAICSKNWYIRKNAAEALFKIGLNDSDVAELSLLEDKYAREIFLYTLEKWKRKAI